MQRFYRFNSEGEDPGALLDPDRQWTEPWGDDDLGKPCDKCGGEGRTEWQCLSCDGSADAACPACGGRVRFVARCPACKGEGRIVDTRRRGVSVFPSEAGLRRYMEHRKQDLSGCVLVELRGDASADEDFDADDGALLVHPTEIVAVGEPE